MTTSIAKARAVRRSSTGSGQDRLCRPSNGRIEALSNRSGELRWQIRFCQKHCVILAKLPAIGIRTVATAVNDLQFRLAFLQLAGQLTTGHPFGHDHIGQK